MPLRGWACHASCLRSGMRGARLDGRDVAKNGAGYDQWRNAATNGVPARPLITPPGLNTCVGPGQRKANNPRGAATIDISAHWHSSRRHLFSPPPCTGKDISRTAGQMASIRGGPGGALSDLRYFRRSAFLFHKHSLQRGHLGTAAGRTEAPREHSTPQFSSEVDALA